MSRVGKIPIELSDKVEFTQNGNEATIKGPLGSLTMQVSNTIKIEKKDNNLNIVKVGDNSFANAMWGTTRSNLNNMVTGVTEGFKKELEISGVGYKYEVQGKKIILAIGLSHKVEVEIPTGVEAKLDDKNKALMTISGIDKQAVGEFAAKVRGYKKPEPYKGKGIKYVEEHIIRKAGKTGAK